MNLINMVTIVWLVTWLKLAYGCNSSDKTSCRYMACELAKFSSSYWLDHLASLILFLFLTEEGGLKCKHPLPQWHGATSLVVHCHLAQFNCTKQNLPVFSAISTFTNKIDVVILLNQVLFYWLIFLSKRFPLPFWIQDCWCCCLCCLTGMERLYTPIGHVHWSTGRV